jgi:hypothetical protein
MSDWAQYVDPPKRRGASPLFIVGLVMLVVAVAVGGYVLYDNRSTLFPAAALPTPTPPPTSSAVALTTPSPTVPASPVVTSEPPSPTPTPVVASPATRFTALIGQPDLSYHLDTVATVRSGGESITLSMSLDQSGPDLAFVMTVKSTMSTVPRERMQVVIRDGVGYAKDGRRPWVRVTDLSSLDLPQGPLGFSGMRTDAIESLGPDSHDGRLLQHLRVLTIPSEGFGVSELASAGCQVTDLPMDLWVRDDGVPVSGEFAYSCAVLDASATYEWSQVGSQITIQVPRAFR